MRINIESSASYDSILEECKPGAVVNIQGVKGIWLIIDHLNSHNAIRFMHWVTPGQVLGDDWSSIVAVHMDGGWDNDPEDPWIADVFEPSRRAKLLSAELTVKGSI